MSMLEIEPDFGVHGGQADAPLAFATQPMIKTRRLTLRKFKPEDQYRIAIGLQDRRVARMLMSVPMPYDHHDALDWIRSWEKGEKRGWGFAMTLDDGALIGIVSIGWRGVGARSGWHLGYWLLPEFWGDGLMSEAVSAVTEQFFAKIVGGVLFSGAINDNPASLKVQDRLGFQVTGISQCFARPRGAMVDLVETEVTFGSFMPV